MRKKRNAEFQGEWSSALQCVSDHDEYKTMSNSSQELYDDC